MFLIASLLSLSHFNPIEEIRPLAIKEFEIHNNVLNLRCHNKEDLRILQKNLSYYLQKDLESFSPLKNVSDLQRGDILLFGENEKEIEVAGIYQQDGEFLFLKQYKDALALSLGKLSDLQWKAFHYQGFFTQSSLQKAEAAVKKEALYWHEFLNGQFVNKSQLPFVLTPKSKSFSLESFVNWNKTKQWQMQSLLNEHGAILLRDFPIHSPSHFVSAFEASVGKKAIDYIGEGSRKKIIPGVYTSTEGPPEFHIHLHHELSCTHFPVSYISFYCEIAPSPGTGQTILGKTESITKALNKKKNVWSFFEGKKIKYISRHPAKENFYTKINKTHKTWPEVFETHDRKMVEHICKEKNLEFVWDGDWIQLTRTVEAIKPADKFFPFSYWYNQLHLYHANPRSRGGFFNHFLANLLYIDPSTRQYDVTLEDGTTIPDHIVYEIYDACEANTIKFDWQVGDVLIVDNRRCLHGRSPTHSARRILASMTD